MKRLLLVAAALALLGLSIAAQAITIDTVAVGNAGNAADTASHSGNPDGQGSVSYNYNIGKYEVTAGQYTAFLNAVAATDTYGLYNSDMWSDTYGCKIQRSGTSGTYSYTVADDWANRPVNYTSFWDACRFANWLSNGQPTGAQNASTTERGTYALDGYTGGDGRTIQRNARWTWAVTSEDEWYKAAYYKGGGVYSLYANGTNTLPASGTDSNYNQAIGHTWDGTTNGALEQNGTRDMMGNVWEWNEAIAYQDTYYAYRGARGGSFFNDEIYLQAAYRYGSHPGYGGCGVGFRVSEVVPAYGISNRAAHHPIISTAAAKFNFRVWGKVTILVSGNSFTVDDGSGAPVRVVAPGFSGIQNGDYASAKGGFSGEGSSRVLNAQACDVVKQQ